MSPTPPNHATVDSTTGASTDACADTRVDRPRQWDLFCHVIDNWGDLGVAWRLATGLAARGQRVRLWVDDPEPLRWMAPGAQDGAAPGIEVRRWPRAEPAPADADTQAPAEGAASTAPPRGLPPSDVLVEAFGCQVPDDWVAALQPDGGPSRRLWINLEYLSAEGYVSRCHGLPSPLLRGALSGRTRWFYYPGFTPGTGGLLREADLLARQQAFDALAWRQRVGLPAQRPVVSLFCYEPPGLPWALQHWGAAGLHWAVAPGRAARAFDTAAAGAPPPHTVLPLLPQPAFDELLWACDLNIVRGEDSLVRALWAARPFIWQPYVQDDAAHHAKLEAFLDWLEAPDWLRRLHRAWSGIDTASPAWPDAPQWQAWLAVVGQARQRLLEQPDLVSQLLRFVQEKS